MERINLRISAIQGYSAVERAEAISRELLKISRPSASEGDRSEFLFPWFNDGSNIVLLCQGGYVVKVHPDHDLTQLKALLPEVTEVEKAALSAYVGSVDSFPFRNIIPTTATKINDYTFGI